MKEYLIIMLFLFININFTLAQDNNTVIFQIDKQDIEYKQEEIIFKLSKENIFRHIKNTQKKRYIYYNEISDKIINLKTFQRNLKIKTSNNDYKVLYKGKTYKILIYVKNDNCENEGTLYEVDELIPIYGEVD